MSEGGMSQEEIDKLLNGAKEETKEVIEKSQTELIDEEKERRSNLTQEEKDVIGEIANISFGSASTVLSSLLNQKVSITTPMVDIIDENQTDDGDLPHVVLNVNYVKGLNIENTLVIKKEVALYIADLMMMGSGEIDSTRELNEMDLSAVQEAMNQMMGMSATSMSEVFQMIVDISPPVIRVENFKSEVERIKEGNNKIVRITFSLEIGDSFKSKMYQCISISNAKQMAAKLLEVMNGEVGNDDVIDRPDDTSPNLIGDSGDDDKGDTLNPLIENVLIDMEIVYGKTTKSLKELLLFEGNHVIELNEDIHEPLKLYANGILVAEGRLLNVNGFFGLEIERIL